MAIPAGNQAWLNEESTIYITIFADVGPLSQYLQWRKLLAPGGSPYPVSNFQVVLTWDDLGYPLVNVHILPWKDPPIFNGILSTISTGPCSI